MESNKDIIEFLHKVFEYINNWLNFAEAKNAANIAFVVAMMQVIISIDFISMIEFKIFLAILLIISGAISIISFIPNLDGSKVISIILKIFSIFFKKNNIKENNNLIFFKDIKGYTKEEYLNQIYKKYFNEDYVIENKYELDLAEEIIENSKIALNKYLLFKISIYFDIVFFVAIIFMLIIA